MSERHIELVWRCSSCKHQNLGRHMACQGCGNPKDESEEYEMPADTSAVATVSDPKLLAMARAGEHWRCAYCSSHQRDLDGGCAQCGAGRKTGANVQAQPAPRASGSAPRAKSRTVPPIVIAVLGFFGLAGVVGGACAIASHRRAAPLPEPPPLAVVATPPPQTDFPATVQSTSWSREVTVERWQLVAHDAFTADLPAGAVNVKAMGEKFHHNEEVFDHDETVYDEVEVPDGTRTETYSVRESCGEDCTPSTRSCRQDCTTKPQTCREVCKNGKNGFASCSQQCTGGGQTCREVCTGSDRKCTTKYCDRTKTREVPKTRRERRPRVVKKYRSEPRNAPWSTYQTWEWAAVRDASASGDNDAPRWPDAGVLAFADAGTLADGGVRPGAERTVRKETLRATLAYEDGRVRSYFPESEAELEELTPGTKVQTRLAGERVTLLRDASP